MYMNLERNIPRAEFAEKVSLNLKADLRKLQAMRRSLNEAITEVEYNIAQVIPFLPWMEDSYP